MYEDYFGEVTDPLAATERKKVPMLQAETGGQQSSSFCEDESTNDGKSDKSSGRLSAVTPRSDRRFVIQPRNIKLNEMFILQSLKNQMKRKYILGMIGKKQSDQLKVERKEQGESAFASCRHVFNRVIVRPLDFVCKITIPCCDEKHWSRRRAAVNPLCGLLIFLIASQRKCSHG